MVYKFVLYWNIYVLNGLTGANSMCVKPFRFPASAISDCKHNIPIEGGWFAHQINHQIQLQNLNLILQLSSFTRYAELKTHRYVIKVLITNLYKKVAQGQDLAIVNERYLLVYDSQDINSFNNVLPQQALFDGVYRGLSIWVWYTNKKSCFKLSFFIIYSMK